MFAKGKITMVKSSLYNLLAVNFFLKISLGLILAVITQLIFSCSTANTGSHDKIIGKSNLNEWKNSSQKKYEIFNTSQIDSALAAKFSIAAKKKNIRFTIFASSSCSECDTYIPKFLRLLSDANINNDNISIYGLDEYWEEPTGNYKKYKITDIPVVIFEFIGHERYFIKNEIESFKDMINLIE